jgi:hypothetical protein
LLDVDAEVLRLPVAFKGRKTLVGFVEPEACRIIDVLMCQKLQAARLGLAGFRVPGEEFPHNRYRVLVRLVVGDDRYHVTARVVASSSLVEHVEEYRDIYNRIRLHEALGLTPPIQTYLAAAQLTPK